MLHTSFYNPLLSYEENYKKGPFGPFADGEVLAQKGEPRYNYHGHKVHLPFGIPPGPLVNSKFVATAFQKGFDVSVYKTVRSGAYPCHPAPNVLPVDLDGDLTVARAKKPVTVKSDYAAPLSITNSFGVPSTKPQEWQADVREAIASAGTGQVCVVSFMGTAAKGQTRQQFIDDHKKVCELVLQTGAPVVEVNLSCPNVGNEGLICYDLKMTADIMAALGELVGSTPLLMKIGYFESEKDLGEIAQIADTYADGVCSINTIQAEVLDDSGKQALPGDPARRRSGICGSAITWAGLEMTRRLSKLREENDYTFSVESMGGVMNVEDYLAYKKAGADVVMSATGAMWNPYLAAEIKASL